MNFFKKYGHFIVLIFAFASCKKENQPHTIIATHAQQDSIVQLLSSYTADTAIIPAQDYSFLMQIRAIANDIDALYNGVLLSMTLQQRYEKIKENMTFRIATITQMASSHYNGNPAFITLTRNSFALMSYDAFTRKYPEFMWTKLGIFAANEVRAGVVVAFGMKSVLETNNIHLVLDNKDITQILSESTQILIGGQLEVLTDIGSLALLNKYGAAQLSTETWLTQEARNGYRIQTQAEAALNNGNLNLYQDLQTQAAIEFGAHEQIYILQKLWDNTLMTQLATINEWITNISQAKLTIFGDIFIGTNKTTEDKQGYIVKIPANSRYLVKAENRVNIARNGFNTLNRLRKDAKWSYWIDYSQIKIGYHLGVYYPVGFIPH